MKSKLYSAILRLGVVFSVLTCCVGCGPKMLEDAALAAKVKARLISGEASSFWGTEVTGAVLELRAEGGFFGRNVSFQGIYKMYDSAPAKFVLLMPQGAKFGQCVAEDAPECELYFDFPGAGDLLRSAFAAAHNLFEARPEETDRYALQYGSDPAGISCSVLVALRQKQAGGVTRNVINSLDGVPVNIYTDYGRGWQISFEDSASSVIGYVYRRDDSGWKIRIRILELLR